jgi:hypothetical protein
MAYLSKYHFSFTDHIGRHTTVYIKEDGFTGDSTEVTAGADPVIIETVSDNDNLFNQIYASTCTINLLATTNFQFIGLFTANAFKYLVEVYQEPEPDETETLFWTGYLLPDEYSEPIDFEKNYPVSIMARDVLGVLNEIDFVQDSGNKYVGKQTVIKIISEILKKTKLNLNINFGINLIENDAPDSITGDTLEGIYLDYRAFYKEEIKDCEYVLKQILQSFGARIIQANGEWWIERIPMYLNSQTIYKYDYNGVLLSSSIINNVLNYTGKYDVTNNRLFFIEKKGNLMINPAYKEININQNYGALASILKNYDFTDYKKRYYTENGINYVTLEYISNWNKQGEFYIILIEEGYQPVMNQTYPLRVELWGMDATDWFYCDPVYIETSPTNILYVTITLGAARNGNFNFQILIGNTYYECVNFEGAQANPRSYEVTNTENYPDLNVGNEIINAKISFLIADTNEGYFKLKFNSDFGNIGITSVVATYQNGSEGYPDDVNYNITIDENNNYKPDKIELILGDLPDIANNEDMYIGGYWYFDGTDFIPTSSWSYFSSSRQLALVPLLAEAIQDQYRVSKHKISGTLFGNFQLNKTIYITMLGNKYYFPIRTAINCKTCKTEIEAIEIVTETEADGGTVWGTENLDYVVSDTDTLTKI